MTNIVIDTNVIVSAALSPSGNPAKIVALISNAEEIQVFCSAEILDEYKRVLAYERFHISKEAQHTIISALMELGRQIEPSLSIFPMSDESDRTFYDTAKASGAILITGNLRRYPAEPFIVTPAGFLQKISN